MQSGAAAYSVNEHSAFWWLADFANGGQSALLAKPIPGRSRKLRGEELSWIADAVRDHNSQRFKFEFGLLPLSLIRYLIKRQLKKEVSVSSGPPHEGPGLQRSETALPGVVTRPCAGMHAGDGDPP